MSKNFEILMIFSFFENPHHSLQIMNGWPFIFKHEMHISTNSGSCGKNSSNILKLTNEPTLEFLRNLNPFECFPKATTPFSGWRVIN
jgi:hypothetical protein